LTDNLFVAPTFRTILDHIAKPALKNAKLRLNCEVIRIENVGPESSGILVKAAGGFQSHFDQVIVTAPLGWLKRNQDVFRPTLPRTLSNAISNIGYGNLDKIFILFPRAFWNSKAQIASDGCTGERSRPAFPIESLFLSPDYALATNPVRWRQEIISLSGLPTPYAQPVVMFFVYGQWGRHISGLVQGMKQDSKEYYNILDVNFRPYYSKLPNYDDESPACRPLEYLSTDWQNDSFAGYGSFCNFPVGGESGIRAVEILKNGMGHDRGVWFAGEHTSPARGLGTVTGAYWSGEEVATKIAELYGRSVVK
jgi:Flavin containing amine oxidoreductase